MATLYLPPVAKVQLDTTVWSFDTTPPDYFQMCNYLSGQRPSVVNKKDGYRIELRLECVGREAILEAKERAKRRNGLSADGRIIQIKGEGTMTVLLDEDFMLLIYISQVRVSGTVQPGVEEIANNVQYVTPAQMDALAGYPLPANTDKGKLIAQRKAEMAAYVKPKKDIYMDHLLLLDLQKQFTFKKYVQLLKRDVNVDYSDCELAFACEAEQYTEDMLWLNTFLQAKNEKANILDDDLLIETYRKHTGNDRARASAISSRSKGDGLIMVYINEPSVTLEACTRAADGNYKTYSETLLPEAYTRHYNGYSLQQYSDDERLDAEAIDLSSLDHSNHTLTFMRQNNKLQMDGQRQVLVSEYPDLYMLSAEYQLDSVIRFTVPPLVSKCDVLFQCHAHDRFSSNVLAQIRTSKGKKAIDYSRYDGIPSFLIYDRRKNQPAITSDTEDTPIPANKRLYRSHVLVSDFNMNGEPEYFLCYAQNGRIVFADMYEAKGTSLSKVKNAEQYFDDMLQIPIVSDLTERSAVAITWYYVNLYNREEVESDYGDDSYPVEEVMMVDEDYGYYDLAAEPEMPYDSYGNSGSGDGTGQGTGNYGPQQKSTTTTPAGKAYYTSTECRVPAAYTGGYKSMQEFIKKNKSIEKSKKDRDKTITVLANCEIDTNGKIKMLDATCDSKHCDAYIEECKRIIGLMPRWSSASVDSGRVVMRTTLAISF
ncbi:MAG: hypothetical protein ACKVOR_12690 [Flavobacteriales bacterium]